ncbi:MAG TPA: phosphatase [Polyangia bacterium]
MRLDKSALFLSLAALSCNNGALPSELAASASADTPAVALQSQLTARGGGLVLTPVANANLKRAGLAPPNILSPELYETPVVQGSNAVENPQTVTSADGTMRTAAFYGYDGDGPLVPAPGDLPSATHVVEASKTEPDKNTYLVLYGQIGPDATYDYGTHFIFQGHESGAPGYVTRVNLDADGAHKVTVMATTDATGAALAAIDGSTWDPFAQRLVFTTENPGAPTYQATVTFPSVVEDISGAVGRGGYEGVQNDDDGNLWIVEDVGGAKPAATPHAKVPNSFVYRFVPKHKESLKEGKLQVLQVASLRTGQPITFDAADAKTDDIGDLHTYGKSFPTAWVTIHDTDVDGMAPFDANALAKSKNVGTPFKRPENGQFRPGSQFREFFFDETGDTDARTEVGAAFGGFGSILKLVQKSPSANAGTLTLFYLSDIDHSGFDNTSFISKDQIVFVEDAGDTLHAQRNGLDSAFLFDVRLDYSKASNRPVRLLAEGRDASATLDSGFSDAALTGFQNEGDNEITGFHVSNGDPSVRGLLGASIPHAFRDGWRMFYTQQHGDNFTWEILAKPGCADRWED